MTRIEELLQQELALKTNLERMAWINSLSKEDYTLMCVWMQRFSASLNNLMTIFRIQADMFIESMNSWYKNLPQEVKEKSHEIDRNHQK